MSTSYDDSRRGDTTPRVAADAGSSTGHSDRRSPHARPSWPRPDDHGTDGGPARAPPEASGIEHIVWVMMENRSFDHFLGWLTHANGRQAGLEYLDQAGVPHLTYPLAPDFQGCGHPDPDHSYVGGRVAYNDGAVDGWLRAGANDPYAIGYYTQQDLAFLSQAALRWTVCDRYFAPIMAGSFPNRLYQHAAQTDRLSNTSEVTRLPTIWDRLEDAGLEGRYYFSDAPFLALWGTRYLSLFRPFGAFLVDALTGQLPQVAFVEPRFLDNASGTSGDDHPYADIRNGQAFLALIYAVLTRSPAWPRTVLIITYDEWGGFFDHVPPPGAGVEDSGRRPGCWAHGWAPGLSRPVPPHLPVRAACGGLERRLRPHLGAAPDRVALGSRPAHRTGCGRKQPR